MKVSRSAFFAWRHTQANPTARMIADRELGDRGLDHAPGEVAALTGWERRGPSLVQQTGPDGRLTGIDAGRHHLDKHLVGRGHRAFHLVNAKNVHVAVLIETNRS
jgi:hypothetical protein